MVSFLIYTECLRSNKSNRQVIIVVCHFIIIEKSFIVKFRNSSLSLLKYKGDFSFFSTISKKLSPTLLSAIFDCHCCV